MKVRTQSPQSARGTLPVAGAPRSLRDWLGVDAIHLQPRPQLRTSGARAFIVALLSVAAGCAAAPSDSAGTAEASGPPGDEANDAASGSSASDGFAGGDDPGIGSDALPGEDTPTDTDAPDSGEDVMPVEPLAALPSSQTVHTTDWFTSAQVCAGCHTMDAAADIWTGSQGEDLSPARLWQGSMMAYSARDPYWLAAWAHELESFPQAEELVSATCTRCHATAAHETLQASGETFTFERMVQGTAPADHLGREGVSCTVCHQIQATDDISATFTGAFSVSHDREIYGPFANPFANPMINQSGFTPTPSDHIRDSQLCASCHTVITRALDDAGSPSGPPFVEQAPYLEWSNSDYRTGASSTQAGQSCQSCHMQSLDATTGQELQTVLSVRPPDRLQVRGPVRGHTFVGANRHMLEVLRAQQSWVGIDVEDDIFATAIDATSEFVARAAAVEIVDVTTSAEGVSAVIRVRNLTGHKFPTGYPSRRAWLEVRAFDADDTVVWHSGAFDDQGALAMDTGDGFEPHHERIDRADQVQIYQSVMADSTGQPTHTLLGATSYAKDNRLLPVGWSTTGEWADLTGPAGVDGDPDFASGLDDTEYLVRSEAEIVRMDVTLWYQSVPAVAVRALHTTPTPASARLALFFEQTPALPVLVSTARWTR